MKRASPRQTKSFKELEAEWYERLRLEGFPEIEDVNDPERRLKEWHNHKFKSDTQKIRALDRERYEIKLSDFINSGEFDEICKLIVNHFNCILTPEQVRVVVEFHRDGLTERTIATRINVSKKCVHLTLSKARSWMKITA